MHLTLVGADLEENLGMGVVAAVAERMGWSTRVVPFDDSERTEEVLAEVLAARPDAVGLSIQFQRRAHEFLELARLLRHAGLEAHLTCGGQWASQAWREALAPRNGIDSVVLREAEATLPALLRALGEGAPWLELPGLAVRTADGAPMQTEPRGHVEDLDSLPFPKRYRPHAEHFGVPFVPMIGGRDQRRRSPENIAEEMAALGRRIGRPSIFCFHDDDFLEPRPEASLERIAAILDAAHTRGLDDFGIVAKCKPDRLTADLSSWLAKQGVLRLRLEPDADSAAHLDRALAAGRAAGLRLEYELPLFEPETALTDLRDRIDFIRQHPDHPVRLRLPARRTGGPRRGARDLDDGLGVDPAALALRLVSAVFRDRNFSMSGVVGRYMGLGYATRVLERFHDHALPWRAQLEARAARLTRWISLETAELLEEARLLVEQYERQGRAWFEGAAAHLAHRVAEIDASRHIELDALMDDMRRYARGGHAPIYRPVTPTPARPRSPSGVRAPTPDTWREVMPKRTSRSKDHAPADAPEIALTAVRHGDAVDATVRVDAPVSLRWQARGRIEGDAETVRWFPADDQDRLVVAVRSEQGLALASVRAKQVA